MPLPGLDLSVPALQKDAVRRMLGVRLRSGLRFAEVSRSWVNPPLL